MLDNGTINPAAPLSIGGGILSGSGAINGGLLCNSPNSILEFAIAGMTPGSGGYDHINVTGDVTLGGDLELSIGDSYRYSVMPTDTFILLTSSSTNPISGAFVNVADGQRLSTTDGYGSFEVRYGGSDHPHELIADQFVAAPEPSLSVVAAGLFVTRLIGNRSALEDCETHESILKVMRMRDCSASKPSSRAGNRLGHATPTSPVERAASVAILSAGVG